ncbi:fumarylacetoacetate hydrolase family protein [Breoghania sp. L-A4]|uniref:fumarylacetoacetate hydrolase family protein n=1 Tax=Breoghania sp. L-A4 TaxID=2304600 RepID=UPI000E35F831|nr:fumarylacetoacetate hydrolase family protein [Breoghania sp. L-A4]AXS40320.1 FAA hydrolase family protein [Breoghania sp. L-A4]
MKLASLNDQTRDGLFVVVSRDLKRYTPAGTVAGSVQAALDDWARAEPELRDLSTRLDIGQIKGEPFDEALCLSPLPRAYQWADGSAYVNHVELVRQARGAEMPETFWTDPLMYQGGSDSFLPPHAPIALADDAWGIDFEAEIAIVTDDVPMGVSREAAAGHIKLLMLVNDVSLRNLIPGELAKGFGFFQAKPSSAFSPVAITPDELGDDWTGGTIARALMVEYNGEAFGKARCDTDMTFDMPRLIAHAAKTRPLGAGCVIGSGTVSNKLDGGPGKTIAEGGVGYSCIAERRTVETIVEGAPKTPFMTFGDRVRIEMKDDDGGSIFGAISQTVTQYDPAE